MTNLKKVCDGLDAYLVGGAVKDEFFGSDSKDLDVEVFGINAGGLERHLSRFGKVSSVGKAFGVLKLQVGDEDFDFSLPRRDSKVAAGHRGFEVQVDQGLTLREAAARRDFTINSIMKKVDDGSIIDLFGGVSDVWQKTLRHTSEAFAEDPLRVLRGFQFCGRFDLTAAPETLELCKSLHAEFHTLPKERVWEEWRKWAEKSVRPSAGLKFIRESGWLSHFPEVEALIGVSQDPEWHPEGDVWEHTLQVVDAAAGSGLIPVLAALCHDLGKPTTTTVDPDGKIRSRGHAEAGVEAAWAFLIRIGAPKWVVGQVCVLVREHLAHLQLSKRAVRRLIVRLGDAKITDLVSVIQADHAGRGRASGHCSSADELLKLAEECKDQVDPVLKGRHLIEAGLNPGRHFRELLDRVFEAQLDGKVNTVEDGLRILGLAA